MFSFLDDGKGDEDFSRVFKTSLGLVKTGQKSIAKGAFKSTYLGLFNNRECVFKVPKDRKFNPFKRVSDVQESFVQKELHVMSKKFSQFIGKQFIFVDTQSCDCDGLICVIEPRLKGDFHRFVDVVGNYNEEHKAPTAFGHWIWFTTNGNAVVTDIQGVKHANGSYELTDPVAHTMNKIGGFNDQGQDGIYRYFCAHKCNNLCEKLPRPFPFLKNGKMMPTGFGDD